MTYGAHGIWSWETTPSVPLKHEGSGVAKPWHGAMRLPGSESVNHLSDLFTSLEWWTLRPAGDLVQDQSDDPRKYVGAAASEEGDLAVVYLPVGGTVHLTEPLLDSGLTARWYNPRDGGYAPAEPVSDAAYAAPDSLDWVVVLQ